MTKRYGKKPATAYGVDLDFRPTGYGDTVDPVAAIVQNITGQNRRTMVRRSMTDAAPGGAREVDEEVMADVLDTIGREMIGRLHPSFLGGEYLPGYASGEVEVARVVLASVTQDVFSLRVRRQGRRYRYRFVGEYETTYTVRPASSAKPLSLREVVRCIDRVEASDESTGGWPFPEQLAYPTLENGSLDAALAFVQVESEVYPELGRYYAERMRAWGEEVRREREEE